MTLTPAEYLVPNLAALPFCVVNALTLTEPWATLMMLRKKRIETRSWRLPNKVLYEPTAIHAAKGWPKWCKDVMSEEPFLSALNQDGQYQPCAPGYLLCVVKFIDCRRTEDVRGQLSEEELEYGDYGDGRWAWFSKYVTRIEPEQAAGHLGFWRLAQ